MTGRATLAVIVALAALTALILFAFLPTLEQGWAPLDDEMNFVDNPDYRGFSRDHLRWMWTTRLAGHYIPLSWMTLAADYEFSGMDPSGYHRTNLLLHLANGCLLFGLAWRLLGLREADWVRAIACFAAAAFFAVHPLRVESVAWITERRDVLCGLFSLLTLHAYLSAVRRPAGLWRWAAWLGVLLAFVAALLSKGIAVVLPVALLALDIVPLGRLPTQPSLWLKPPFRAVLVEKLPFAALTAAFAAVVFWAIAPVMADRTQATLEHRALSAGYGLSFYLEKTLTPIGIPFQVPATHQLSAAKDPEHLLRSVLFLASLSAALAARHRWPALALALLVYTAFVLPVSGLFQAGPQLVAHRYSYLATMPIALLLPSVVGALLRRGPALARVSIAVAVVGLSTGLAVLARAQVEHWRDAVTFSRAAVRSAPRAWAPVAALARAHLERGETKTALAELRAGRTRIPDHVLLLYLEVVVLSTSPDAEVRDGDLAVPLAQRVARLTRYQDPAALLALSFAVAEEGDSDQARWLLESARALCQAGRKPELLPTVQEAARQLRAQGVVRWQARDWAVLPL